MTIDIAGCASRDDARKIAKPWPKAPLVKTAIAGADPNWGRIVSAAGYAGVMFRPTGVSLWVNGLLLYDHGVPVRFDALAVSRSIRENRETAVKLQFEEGEAGIRFWTTDLTAEYVRLNTDLAPDKPYAQGLKGHFWPLKRSKKWSGTKSPKVLPGRDFLGGLVLSEEEG